MILNKEIGSKKIKAEEIALICSKYSTILRSGAQVLTCTRLIANQTSNKTLKKMLDDICIDLESGKSLGSSFERRAGDKMPASFYETIKAGENLGQLVMSFESLSQYYKKQSNLSRQVKSALIYPVFVIAVAIVVLIVVMAYVMPKLVGVFETMGGDIPSITRALMVMSDFFSSYWILIIIAMALCALVYKIALSNAKTKAKIDYFKLKLPVVGKLISCNEHAKFASTLSMLLSSGLPMSRALNVLSKVFENSVFTKATLELKDAVISGKSLGRTMKKKECFMDTLVQMTAIGEETGEIEGILKTTGEHYQSEAENLTKNLLLKLEPSLLIFIAAFAGFIVFAIYIPLFQMYDLF